MCEWMYISCYIFFFLRYALAYIIIIIYSLKPPQVRKTYYIVYYIHIDLSQIRNITVYVLKAGQ